MRYSGAGYWDKWQRRYDMGALAVLPFLLVVIWAGIEQADNEKNADLYKDDEED